MSVKDSCESGKHWDNECRCATTLRAEDVAKKLYIDMGNCPEFHNAHCSCFGKIEKALTEYAEARVEEIKEDRNRWADSAERLEKAQEKIRIYERNSALEEAANAVRSYVFENGESVNLLVIADKIESLKKETL